MTQIIGQRGTASYGSGGTGERKYDVSDRVFLLDPGQHPLLTLLTTIGKVSDGVSWKGSALKKSKVIDPEFKESEDTYGENRTQLATAISSNATTALVVDDASIFAPGDVILAVDATDADQEQMLVTVVNTSTNTLTVVRGRGTTPLTAIAIDSNIHRIGNSSEEGADVRSANTTAKTSQSNYTQIFRTPWALTNTQANTTMYTGDEEKYQRMKKGIAHALDIERAFWFGNKAEVTGAGGQAQRYTGGILERINELGASYIQDQAATELTQADFGTFMRTSFQHGSTTKTLFASGTILAAIEGFATGQIRIQPKEKTYGIQLSSYMSSFGTLNLVNHPFFTSDFDGYAVVLDLDSIEYKFLQNRDTSLVQNRQLPGVDGLVNEYVTECGLARHNFEKNALLKGVVASEES